MSIRYDEFGPHPHGTPLFAFCVFCEEYEKKDTKRGKRLVRCKANKVPFVRPQGKTGCCHKKERLGIFKPEAGKAGEGD